MAIPPELSAALTDILKAAALPAIGYVVSAARSIKQHVRTTDERLTKVEHSLWGEDGKNGIKSVANKAAADVRELEKQVARLEERTA